MGTWPEQQGHLNSRERALSRVSLRVLATLLAACLLLIVALFLKMILGTVGDRAGRQVFEGAVVLSLWSGAILAVVLSVVTAIRQHCQPVPLPVSENR